MSWFIPIYPSLVEAASEWDLGKGRNAGNLWQGVAVNTHIAMDNPRSPASS